MGEIDKTYGAALIGVCFSLILYGVTNLQTFVYVCNYPRDAVWNKLAVFWLWILDTIHVVVCIYMMYWYLITNYGKPSELVVVHWTFEAFMILTAIVLPSVQAFYAVRICKLDATIHKAGSKRSFRPITIITIIAILAAIAAALAICYEDTHLMYFSRAFLPSVRWSSYYPLTTTTWVDLQIAASLCYLLSRCRTGYRQTNTTVTWLMFYIVNTGFLTSLCSLTSVIMFTALPGTFSILTFEFIMTKLYINSYLAMLNARTSLRGVGPNLDGMQDAFRNNRMKAFSSRASSAAKHLTSPFSGAMTTPFHSHPIELDDPLAVTGRTRSESHLRMEEGSADAKAVDWEEQSGDAVWAVETTGQERCLPSSAIARKPPPALSRIRQSIIDPVRLDQSTGGGIEE